MTVVIGIAAVAGIAFGLGLASRWVRHDVAYRNYQGARAAVPIARRAWFHALRRLATFIALTAICLALAWVISQGPQGGPQQ